jgi:hypothetical protein
LILSEGILVEEDDDDDPSLTLFFLGFVDPVFSDPGSSFFSSSVEES